MPRPAQHLSFARRVALALLASLGLRIALGAVGFAALFIALFEMWLKLRS